MKKFSLNPFSSQQDRPPLEGLYAYAMAVLIGYWAADLTILGYRGEMLPSEAPPVKAKKHRSEVRKFRTDYDIISQRNIFNSDGKIPNPKSATEKDGESEMNAPAVASQLPIKLLGTLVHANTARSIATLNFSSKNKTGAYIKGDDMLGLATVVQVERKKITFRNKNNGRLEYIEIPEDNKITFGRKVTEAPPANKLVSKVGKFDFSLKRSDVDKYTSNLSGILNQARMVPNRVNGQVEGFRFTSIKPGSVFEKLGFKPNDVIKGVNGDDVNSPTKAMELFNTLKTSNDLRLNIERNGQTEEFRYSID